ncbi:hypothetical protein CPB84DRAFT_1765947 [Gymnopilus junonius]|uniref:Uncharacterized protein n=1 Tax=Gymnopilus junonius TaxID=109634 RepID=A0A9P5NY63_GYMJU|nr:hypothetical protein CPB84DRAFT_1765947 [Gymnopilus junonius]
MFRTHSPYSPFFTSGLLSERLSRPVSPDQQHEHASAFYFTLQPRRDEHQFRSYLSLDLAESQSMRSASLKRNASSQKPFRFPTISETPSMPATAPLRMRYSRDSLRTIPSPKPAPSITLPDLPKISQTPPRLPSLLPLPALDLTVPTVARASSPRNVPALTVTVSNHRVSVASSSTVSTRARKYNRSEALARLEGRSRSAPITYSKRNFMSMSDDEDDDDQDADDEDSDLESLNFPDVKVTLLNGLMEPEDMVLPLPSPSKYLEAPRSAPLPPRRAESPIPNGHLAVGTGLRRQRTRKQTKSKDWFPLKSFIDLHNDDDTQSTANLSSNWAWRSFIEVANVS